MQQLMKGVRTGVEQILLYPGQRPLFVKGIPGMVPLDAVILRLTHDVGELAGRAPTRYRVGYARLPTSTSQWRARDIVYSYGWYVWMSPAVTNTYLINVDYC